MTPAQIDPVDDTAGTVVGSPKPVDHTAHSDYAMITRSHDRFTLV
jgi:hypothetical protein